MTIEINKSVEAPQPIEVNDYRGYVEALAELMVVDRLGIQSHLDSNLVNEPEELMRYVILPEHAPEVVLNTIDTIQHVGHDKPESTTVHISSRSTPSVRSNDERYENLSDEKRASVIFAETAKLVALHQSHYVPDYIKHVGEMLEWRLEDRVNEAIQELGGRKVITGRELAQRFSLAFAVGLSACAPAIATMVPGDIIDTPQAPDVPQDDGEVKLLNASTAMESFEHWNDFKIGSQEFSVIAQPDFADYESGQLVILSPKVGGDQVDATIQFAIGEALLSDNKALDFLFYYDSKTGETAAYALIFDDEISTDTHSEFILADEDDNGQLQVGDRRLIVNKEEGRVEAFIQDTATQEKMQLAGLNTENLASPTPEPTDIPDKFLDALIGSVTGAENVQAAGPEPTGVKPTEVVEPTPEPTTTPDANMIAQEMGYRQDEYSFSEDGNYVTRDLNGEMMVKLENKEWIKTSKEERYQPLLDGALEDFIDGMDSRGDLIYPNDMGIHATVIKPIYTGEHYTEEYFFKNRNETVNLTVLEAVIPDDSGEIITLRIALGSNDLDGNILCLYRHPNSRGDYDHLFASAEEVESNILPGEQLHIRMVTERLSDTMPGKFCYENTGYCTIDYYLSEEIRRSYGDNYAKLIETLKDGVACISTPL